MIGILLENHTVAGQHMDAMIDAHFTLKDLIYIVTLIVGVVLGWTRIQSKTNENKMALKSLNESVNKEFSVIKSRIDKTQERMEKDRTDNQAEFKSINKTLNKIVGLLENKK